MNRRGNCHDKLSPVEYEKRHFKRLGSAQETGGDSHIETFPRIIVAANLLLKLATPAVNGHIDCICMLFTQT